MYFTKFLCYNLVQDFWNSIPNGFGVQCGPRRETIVWLVQVTGTVSRALAPMREIRSLVGSLRRAKSLYPLFNEDVCDQRAWRSKNTKICDAGPYKEQAGSGST